MFYFRDTSPILYHICECNDSLICIECYNNDLAAQMTNCGICRKRYSHKTKRDYKFFFKLIYPSIILHFLTIL